jgi:[ribosomal protein S5]-alanine N-acetyltransferase
MPVETSRLLLREITLGDLDFMAAMLGDPDVMRFWPKPMTRQEAEEEIRKIQTKYAKDGCSFWLAVEKSSGQPIGQAGILIQSLNGKEEAELAYKTHRPYWRQGYALEASRACLRYAFDVLRRERVISRIRPENTPSVKLASKLGLKPESRTIFAGFEHIIFSIDKTDFSAAHMAEDVRPLPSPGPGYAQETLRNYLRSTWKSIRSRHFGLFLWTTDGGGGKLT